MATQVSTPGSLNVCPLGGPCCGGVHLEEMSKREREAFFHVVAGRTIREVAAAMNVRPKTAENYRCRVLAKVRVRNAVEAVHFAVRHGLLVVGDGRCGEDMLPESRDVDGRREWMRATDPGQRDAAGWRD